MVVGVDDGVDVVLLCGVEFSFGEYVCEIEYGGEWCVDFVIYDGDEFVFGVIGVFGGGDGEMEFLFGGFVMVDFGVD